MCVLILFKVKSDVVMDKPCPRLKAFFFFLEKSVANMPLFMVKINNNNYIYCNNVT